MTCRIELKTLGAPASQVIHDHAPGQPCEFAFPEKFLEMGKVTYRVPADDPRATAGKKRGYEAFRRRPEDIDHQLELAEGRLDIYGVEGDGDLEDVMSKVRAARALLAPYVEPDPDVPSWYEGLAQRIAALEKRADRLRNSEALRVTDEIQEAIRASVDDKMPPASWFNRLEERFEDMERRMGEHSSLNSSRLSKSHERLAKVEERLGWIADHERVHDGQRFDARLKRLEKLVTDRSMEYEGRLVALEGHVHDVVSGSPLPRDDARLLVRGRSRPKKGDR